jgi:hypothetical protein
LEVTIIHAAENADDHNEIEVVFPANDTARHTLYLTHDAVIGLQGLPLYASRRLISPWYIWNWKYQLYNGISGDLLEGTFPAYMGFGSIDEMSCTILVQLQEPFGSSHAVRVRFKRAAVSPA